MNFTGKTAIVTGGASGIGGHTAVTLSREGANVAILDCNVEAGAKMAAENGLLFCKCDVKNIQEIGKAFDEVKAAFGTVDILVNSAGIATHTSFCDVTEEEWDRLCDTNLKGTFFCSQQAVRMMKADGHGGKIVNLSSLLAERVDGRHTTYGATKAGILAVTRSIAIAFSVDEIYCNSIAPAYVLTHMTEHNLSNPKWMEALRARVPKGKMIDLAEVTNAILFFCSDSSNGITGQNLFVDEGWSINA